MPHRRVDDGGRMTISANDIPGFYWVHIFDTPPFRMFCAGDSHRYIDIVTLRHFEPTSMRLWCNLARTASTIVDIGAQEGVYSLAAAALRDDIPIHSFEPNPDAFARLAVHKRINGFQNIELHREALADRRGVATISWVYKDGFISSGGHLGETQGRHESVLAVAEKFSNYDIKLGQRGLMKIDVEGAEALVLRGMSLESRPDILLETFDASNCNEWNKTIEPLGYRVWKIYERAGKIEPVDGLTPRDPKSGDFNHYLSVRDLP